MLFYHLTVCITIIKSAVLCPIVFNSLIVYFIKFFIFKRRCAFLLRKKGFLNKSPIKPAVICQVFK